MGVTDNGQWYLVFGSWSSGIALCVRAFIPFDQLLTLVFVGSSTFSLKYRHHSDHALNAILIVTTTTQYKRIDRQTLQHISYRTRQSKQRHRGARYHQRGLVLLPLHELGQVLRCIE